jgi:hypothetical protein
MSVITVKLDDEYTNLVNDLCKSEDIGKSELIRKALKFYSTKEKNSSKELIEIESQNKQLSITVQSMKMLIDEKDSKYEEMMRMNQEKYDVLEVVQKEQANVYQNILKQKDDLLTEIKNMSMWKRAFLKLA